MKAPAFLRSRAARTGVALAATLPLLAACGSAEQTEAEGETITFAAIPAESSDTLESTYENIVELLEQETGHPVEFQHAADYAAVVEGQRAGQIDISAFGPFTYVIAKDSGVPIEAVAAPSDAADQPPTYTSLAYVPADSDIQSIEDLEGKNVCFVDVASTSGYLVPTKGLQDAGLDIDADLTAVIAGGHDASLLGASAGDCDAAFSHDTMLGTLTETGQIEEGELRPIWESDPIVEYPIALNTETLDEELQETIRTAIQEKANKPALVEAGICDSEEDCALPEETGWGYLAVEDSDFDFIRNICETTNADACQATA